MVMVKTRRKHIRRGLVTVEAALVFPLLILLTFGAIKYGWLFLKAQQITNITRYGARLAILPDATSDDVKNAMINMLAVSNIAIGSVDITITPADFSSLSTGDPIEVCTVVPTADVDIMNIAMFPSIGNIRASVSMAKEGYAL